jgi:dTDP-4-dehydrorhamnose reductase
LTPTFIDNLASFLNLSISDNLKGIYHLASSDVVTPYSFGQIISEIFGFNYPISQGSIIKFQSDFPNKAKRPQIGGLRMTKLDELNFPTLSNHDAIRLLKEQIASKSVKIS